MYARAPATQLHRENTMQNQALTPTATTAITATTARTASLFPTRSPLQRLLTAIKQLTYRLQGIHCKACTFSDGPPQRSASNMHLVIATIPLFDQPTTATRYGNASSGPPIRIGERRRHFLMQTPGIVANQRPAKSRALPVYEDLLVLSPADKAIYCSRHRDWREAGTTCPDFSRRSH